MKATLEYDLLDQEQENAFQRAVKATDMALVLWQFIVNGHRKYENDPKIIEGYEKAQQEIREELFERGINIEILVQ